MLQEVMKSLGAREVTIYSTGEPKPGFTLSHLGCPLGIL